MATTVGSHAVAQFTSPVNQTSPIDANQVRGNDNTLRTAYVAHDADAGVHVQSSTLASRPVAGVAGRKWITAGTGAYTLWYDDGSTWHEVSNASLEIEVLADANLVAGDVVKVTGYNNGQSCPTVNKVASAADVAFGIVKAAIGLNTKGYIVNTGTARDVNTNAHAVGTILYPDASGGLTATKPTSGNYQVVAYVLRQNTNNGVLYVEFSAPRIVERSDNTASTIVLRDASGNFSAGTITATAVNTTTLDLTNLEVTNIKAKDGTAAATVADATGVVTVSAAPVLSALTASQAVFTNGSKGLVSNAVTGTGNVVMSASPTLTGTVTAATLNATTLGGTLSTAAQPNVTSVGTLTGLTVTNPIAGSVTGSSGSTTGNAATATALQTARTINGVSFNGTADITVTAAAGTLSGSTLASGVTASSLTSVGTLSSLTVSGDLTVDTSTLKVDSANNRVGIGTASPVAPLDVKGISNGLQARFGNIAGRGLEISTAANGGITEGTSVLNARGSTSGVLVFQTQSTERARITQGGYLKASNTGTYFNASGAYHELVTDGASTTAYVRNTASSPFGLELSFLASPDDNTQWFLKAQDGTTARCYIWSDGDLANHDGVYGTISDAKLKQDIIDAPSQWDDLKAVRFRKYRFKSDVAADPNAPFLLGVVAQELAETSPGLVDEHPDMASVEVEVEVVKTRPVLDEDGEPMLDEDGAPLTEEYTETETKTEQRPTGTTTKSVKSSILLMKAAVALQEAMARIESLEARLAALEAQ